LLTISGFLIGLPEHWVERQGTVQERIERVQRENEAQPGNELLGMENRGSQEKQKKFKATSWVVLFMWLAVRRLQFLHAYWYYPSLMLLVTILHGQEVVFLQPSVPIVPIWRKIKGRVH
jgi:hypothetical protein